MTSAEAGATEEQRMLETPRTDTSSDPARAADPDRDRIHWTTADRRFRTYDLFLTSSHLPSTFRLAFAHPDEA